MQLISVLIPIHKKTVKNYRAINSVLSQSYKNTEILLLIDGLNSSLLNELKIKYKSKINKNVIKIIFLNQVLGLTKMLNIGISKAKGNIIMRNDYDDISKPDRAMKQMQLFNKNKEIKLVYSHFNYFNDQNQIIRKKKPNYVKNKFKKILNYKNPIAHSSVMFEKKFIQNIGGYDENLKVSQDFDLWSRVINTNINSVDLVRESLVLININDQSISNKKSKLQRYNSIFICMNNKYYPKKFNHLDLSLFKKNELNYYNALKYAYLYENNHSNFYFFNFLLILFKVYYNHPGLFFKRILFKNDK